KINDVFGENTQLVLLVPKGDIGKEEQLVQTLEDNPEVQSVMAYVNTVGAAIPPEYLDESVTGQFYSDHYSRLIVNTNLGVEGERAFSFIDEIYETVDIFYPEGYHALGESITLYDMRNVVQEDNTFVNV